MATTPLTPIVFAGSLTTTFQDIYVVPAAVERIGIDSAVFNNYSGNSVNYTVRLIQVGSSTDLTEVITAKNIRKLSNDLAPAMIGQALVKGGIIQAKASVNDAINVNITATLVSD